MTGNCKLCSINNIDNEEMSQLENIQKANYDDILKHLNNDFPELLDRSAINK